MTSDAAAAMRCGACGLTSKPSQRGAHHPPPKHRPLENIKIRIDESGETYAVKNTWTDSTIKDLKAMVEFAAGIPAYIQRISFLDSAEIPDDAYLAEHEIASGCTLRLAVWNVWSGLVEAICVDKHFDKVIAQGVTEDSTYSSPHSDAMIPGVRKLWLQDRGTTALTIAAHRGLTDLLKRLIMAGVDVNGVTPSGRTALHIAAANGNGKVIDILLHNGAKIDLRDVEGNTALDIANIFDQKTCARHLFLFRWQYYADLRLRRVRAAKEQPVYTEPPMMAHQHFDSSMKVWMSGTQGQVYLQQLPPPGDKSRWNPQQAGICTEPPKKRERVKSVPVTRSLEQSEGRPTSGGGNCSAEYLILSQGVNFGVTKQRRPKSPAFAYPNGRCPSNPTEGKKTYEEWLAEKSTKSSKHNRNRPAHYDSEAPDPNASMTLNFTESSERLAPSRAAQLTEKSSSRRRTPGAGRNSIAVATATTVALPITIFSRDYQSKLKAYDWLSKPKVS